MTPPYQLSPRALRDLRSIRNYIAEDNQSAALRVESALLDACELLAANPLLGSERPQTTHLPVRFWPVSRFPNYLVVYLPETSPVAVVAILHGKRNIKKILKWPKTT